MTAAAAVVVGALLAPGLWPQAQAPSREVIAEVRVHGNHVSPDEEIIKLSGVTIGEPFGPTTIADVTGRLKSSGKFDDVQVLKRFASIEDPTRIGPKLKKFRPVSAEHGAMVWISTSMAKQTPIEIVEPIEWRVELMIPFAVMEPYVGAIGDLSGQVWRGNLFKCADQTSHPHWASWSPIGEALNFHQPDKFGTLRFE